ncbi:hypothetical protein MY3296_007912 [Beauveria thailandica]
MDLVSQLRTSLAAQSLPPASTSFLTTLISARTPPPPTASLLATAKARLLACDLTEGNGATTTTTTTTTTTITTTSILDADAVAAFPVDVGSARVEKRTLPRDVHVQVLDVENLSLSRWEQVEELEAVERGERRQGREVIRVTADEEGQGAEEHGSSSSRAAGTQGRGPSGAQQVTAARNAVHRLVLQDCKGQTVYAVEMKRMDSIGIGKTSIGEKMLLRAGSVVARGSVLLTPDKTVFLGGKVESWHDAWATGRLARLKAAVGGADRPQ